MTKPKIDILFLANNNTDSIDKNFELLKQSLGKEKISNLKQEIEKKLEFSINVKNGYSIPDEQKEIEFEKDDAKFNLNLILENGEYLNAWELKGEQKAKKHFGNYSTVREAFDDYFKNGRKFKYMNLNFGTLGIPKWGPLLLVFEVSFFTKDEIVGLKHDSLLMDDDKFHYFDDNRNLRHDIFDKDLSVKAMLVKLLLLKNGLHLSEDKKDFDILFFNKHSEKQIDYFEVITWKRLLISQLGKLRIKKAIFDAVDLHLQNLNIAGYRRSEYFHDLVKQQTLINKYRKDYKLKLELV